MKRLLLSLLLLVTLVTLTVALARAEDEEQPAEKDPNTMAAEAEDKYRPMIRCVACEHMVKEYIRRMQSTPLGRGVKAGRFQESGDGEGRLQRATAAAWATELLGGLCETALPSGRGTKRDRIYCEQAEEACEDKLVEFGTEQQLRGSVASVAADATAERICAEAKYCTFRGALKDSFQGMQERAAAEIRQRTGITHLLWRELKKNAWWYVGLLVVSTVGFSATLLLIVLTARRFQPAVKRPKTD